MVEHGYTRNGVKDIKNEPSVLDQQIKGASSDYYSLASPFSVGELKRLFLEWAVCINITLRQSISQRLSKIFLLLNLSSQKVFPTSHNTTRTWIVFAFTKEKNTIGTLVTVACSRVSIIFDAWSSNNDLSLLGVVAHFLDEKHELKHYYWDCQRSTVIVV